MSNSDKFQWVDIEKMIFKTVTIVFKNKKEIFSNSEFPNDQARMKFINIVQYCFKDNKDLSTSMLDSLKKFEKSFALYIKNLIYKSKDHYFKRSEKLLKYLTSSYNEEIVHLDVINFNYSLDENIVNQMIHEKRFSNITFNSWTNIHGVASWNDSYTRSQINKLHSNYKRLAPPIFGIDWHDISDTTNDIDFNDPRIIFTKSFRLIDNQVNNMRDKKHQFQKNINKIIFFGHSLGHADYSYFESLFDIYNIYDSNIELNFYYKKGSSDFLDRLSAQKTLEEIIKLLTSYGQTSTNQHGENIVNKLLLEQRLNLLPSPSINKGTL
ncbi:AbiH family protein [Lactobacillus paragasseri]|uniref:AbiH family protein n=3 Tax=Lactobacillaceae TaxID=33958 RepID=UPI0028D26015|nr:AbiH family protein [Lactobacillus paragasseri]